MKSNIYRLHKYEWTPLLRFGAARTRDISDGWHSFPDNAPRLRMMGGKYINPDNSEHYVVAHEGSYTSYDAQVAGTEFHIKYDPTLLTSLYYRYSNVSEVLFDMNTALDLEVISFREHMIDFGNLNLNNLSKLRSFEISRGGSIDSVTFHPSAPLNYIYLDETTMPQSVIDYCVIHAYNSGITNGQLLSPPPSCDVVVEAQALVDRGWVGFTVPVCEPVEPSTLTLDRYSEDVSDSSNYFNVYVTSNTTWTPVANVEWIHVAWGGGTITVNYQSNTSTNDRSGTITVSTDDGAVTRTFTINQAAKATSGGGGGFMIRENLTYATLGTTPEDAAYMACYYMDMNGGEDSDTVDYYLMDDSFAYATEMYNDTPEQNYAPEGYFSNGVISRYWTGSMFSSFSYTCPTTYN